MTDHDTISRAALRATYDLSVAIGDTSMLIAHPSSWSSQEIAMDRMESAMDTMAAALHGVPMFRSVRGVQQ